MAHILVVDDDADFVEVQKVVLQHAGYSVSCAYSAEEARGLLAESDFDVILLDLMMEHSDEGFRLAREIKSDNESVPVMMLSGVRREHDVGFDFESPASREWIAADAYLEKPVPEDLLLEKVRRLLNGAIN